MIETFRIIVKGRSFSFSLKSGNYGSQTFVVTNMYRPVFWESGLHVPITPQSVIEEFSQDLNTQVNFINNSSEAISVQAVFDACCYACDQHIIRHGRLLIADMFLYLDIFAILYNTIFGESVAQTKNMYFEGIKVLGHSLNQHVECPGGFYGMMDFDTYFDTWARKRD